MPPKGAEGGPGGPEEYGPDPTGQFTIGEIYGWPNPDGSESNVRFLGEHDGKGYFQYTDRDEIRIEDLNALNVADPGEGEKIDAAEQKEAAPPEEILSVASPAEGREVNSVIPEELLQAAKKLGFAILKERKARRGGDELTEEEKELLSRKKEILGALIEAISAHKEGDEDEARPVGAKHLLAARLSDREIVDRLRSKKRKGETLTKKEEDELAKAEANKGKFVEDIHGTYGVHKATGDSLWGELVQRAAERRKEERERKKEPREIEEIREPKKIIERAGLNEAPPEVLYNVLREGTFSLGEGERARTFREGGNSNEREWAREELRRRGLPPTEEEWRGNATVPPPVPEVSEVEEKKDAGIAPEPKREIGDIDTTWKGWDDVEPGFMPPESMSVEAPIAKREPADPGSEEALLREQEDLFASRNLDGIVGTIAPHKAEVRVDPSGLLLTETEKETWPEGHEAPRAKEFDPELRAVLAAPSAKRKELLAEVVARIHKKRAGVASAQARLMDEIQIDPDMRIEEFYRRFREYTEGLGLSDDEMRIAVRTFHDYQKKRDAVLSAREAHPNDSALFAAAFGHPPKGRVEVIVGSATLCFRLHDTEDYAHAGSRRLDDGTPLTEDDMRFAKDSNGCLVLSLLPNTSGAVFVEKAEGREFDKVARHVYLHEEQHALNRMLMRNREDVFAPKTHEVRALDAATGLRDIMEVEQQEKDPKKAARLRRERKQHTERFLLAYRAGLLAKREFVAEQNAADEILAYFKDGRSPAVVLDVLTKGKKEGGLYDYLSENREDIDPEKGLRALGLSGKRYSALIPEMKLIKDRLFGDGYTERLKEALGAYEGLRKGGFREEAIRALFQEEKLRNWKKVADRMLSSLRPVSPRVLAELDTLGLSEDEARMIPGFRDLTEGQQLLVGKRAREAALDEIDASAIRGYREKLATLGKTKGWTATLKRMWLGATKEYQLGKERDAAKKAWIAAPTPDLKMMKRDLFEAMTREALLHNEFDVVERDGRLSTEYLSAGDLGGEIDHIAGEKVRAFNEAANALAQAPHDGDPAEKERAERTYEAAAREMTEYLAGRDSGGKTGPLALRWRAKVDAAVGASRFWNDHPDAEKEFATAGKHIGAAIGFKNILVERSVYTGVSALARGIGVAGVGLAAIPLVAAAGGYVMGKRRKEQELSENELLAEMGEADHVMKGKGGRASAEKNFVSAEALAIKLREVSKEFTTLSQKEGEKETEVALRSRAGKLARRKSRTGKGIVTETITKKEEMRRRLLARIAYTERKLADGLVALAEDPRESGADRINTLHGREHRGAGKRALLAYELSRALADARAALAFDDVGEDALVARMESILDIRERSIERGRRRELAKAGARGAFMGAVFSGVGLAVGEATKQAFGSFVGGGERIAYYMESEVERVAKALGGTDGEETVSLLRSYMTATTLVERKAIAEALNMTTDEVEAKIEGAIASGASRATEVPQEGGKGGAEAPAPRKTPAPPHERSPDPGRDHTTPGDATGALTEQPRGETWMERYFDYVARRGVGREISPEELNALKEFTDLKQIGGKDSYAATPKPGYEELFSAMQRSPKPLTQEEINKVISGLEEKGGKGGEFRQENLAPRERPTISPPKSEEWDRSVGAMKKTGGDDYLKDPHPGDWRPDKEELDARVHTYDDTLPGRPVVRREPTEASGDVAGRERALGEAMRREPEPEPVPQRSPELVRTGMETRTVPGEISRMTVRDFAKEYVTGGPRMREFAKDPTFRPLLRTLQFYANKGVRPLANESVSDYLARGQRITGGAHRQAPPPAFRGPETHTF